MNSREAIQLNLATGEMVSLAYVGDLSDDQLMKRPHPNCNHINWQLGHLILNEHEMVNAIYPGSMPELPAGFAGRYGRENAKSDDPKSFDNKEVLLETYKKQRAGTLAALAKATDADLDKPSPEAMQGYAPNYGAVFSLQGGHYLMHAGQWAVVRRQLGLPPLF